nr:protein CYSTEINE-RICH TRANSMEMBRANE MODULE 11-like [Lolium perenne]
MEGSRDAYPSQVHNVYPYPQAMVYPPAPPISQGYQTNLGEASAPYSSWSGQPAAPPDHGPYLYRYHDDPDCFTFLRGCLTGLCCCCLLGRCCY